MSSIEVQYVIQRYKQSIDRGRYVMYDDVFKDTEDTRYKPEELQEHQSSQSKVDTDQLFDRRNVLLKIYIYIYISQDRY